MSDAYNPQEIEPKWQQKWQADGLYRAVADPDQPKFYALTMLPYPSGDLHIGHWYAMTPSDARARYMRMRGYNVLFPMGFDAFGLPAENAAIKRKTHPKAWTYANIERMRGQLRSMGTMIDWQREAVSADPEYYRWTQWFFVQFFNNDLAYRKLSAVDFCPNCNTTLAREQVWEVNGKKVCERCGTPVIKKNLNQWYFRITNYADDLLDFSRLNWPERVMTMQTNWIGRSEGAEVTFHTEAGHELPIFTTRPDTLWGATFMVMAPEHPLALQLATPEHHDAVHDYIEQAAQATDIEREAAERPKTGVFTGAYAVNPVNQARIPIWIADYVLMGYGTGVIMAVPAHDERDFDFARQYGLEIIPVIQPEGMDAAPGDHMAEAYVGPGTIINSGPLDGTPVGEGKGRRNPSIAAAIDWLEKHQAGREAINYRLRDWLISRQRYWGAPIPILYCEQCGTVTVPEEELPVLLPDDIEFMPTGESPLKLHPTWRHTTCPQCGGPAERETDTMDTFMCSSWYQYRYLSPQYDQYPFDPEEAAYWLPVDVYTGGIEHATMHLLYTRFFTRAMRECGVFEPVQPANPTRQPESIFTEPMTMLYNQGIILGEDREKMSKSRGNVVAPDELVERFGADVVRGYLMFAFKWEQGGPWDSQGVAGVVRFLHDVWNLITQPLPEDTGATLQAEVARGLRRKTHQTIQKVTEDLENFSFNTAIAALMELKNTMQDARRSAAVYTQEWDEARRTLLLLMAPFTPHIAEELWARSGYEYSVHRQRWPQADPEVAAEDYLTVIVQVNGKLKDRVVLPAAASEEAIKQAALASEKVAPLIGQAAPQKVIYVPGKLVNIVLA